MLDVTMSTTFIPGDNVRGQVAGANWVFLRPAVSASRVVCLGVPPSATLATLAGFSETVLLLPTSTAMLLRARRLQVPQNVRLWAPGQQVAMPFGDRTVDLVVMHGWQSRWRLRCDGGLRAALGRALKPDALVYFEHLGAFDPLRTVDLLDGTMGGHEIQRLRLAPFHGELHSAIPACDTRMAQYFREHDLTGRSRVADAFRRAGSRVGNWLPTRGAAPPGDDSAREGLASHRARRPNVRVHTGPWGMPPRIERRGVLYGGPAAAMGDGPPAYLKAVAGAFGINLDRASWGFTANGAYSSRKLLFYLADVDGAAGTQCYVAKMVRAARFNSRLENEYRALMLLCRSGAAPDGSVPRAVFFGHHAGLAIVGETLVAGEPFTRLSRATADCPYFQAALEWFTALAANTTARDSSPGETASTCAWLLARFNELYHSTADERRFLESQMAALDARAAVLPTVFQHGDPGTWNMLAMPGRRVALLDWEAAEPHGLPLWDLFYFLRSYAVGAARTAGVRNQLEGFTVQLLGDTPLSARAAVAISEYCRRVHVPPDLVGPLFYACWMHRALKEATRLPRGRMGGGHYVNLLRLLIARHDTPGLGRFLCRQTP
jgi:hypothetical protein